MRKRSHRVRKGADSDEIRGSVVAPRWAVGLGHGCVISEGMTLWLYCSRQSCARDGTARGDTWVVFMDKIYHGGTITSRKQLNRDKRPRGNETEPLSDLVPFRRDSSSRL